MRLSKHAMRTTLVLASQDRQARHNRNDPSNPSQRQDLTRWDDKGGASRSGHHFSAPSLSQPEAETALYYFSIHTGSRLVEDPEENRYPDLQAAREVAVAMACDLMAEGDQQGEDRQSWHVEIMDRANHVVMMVAFVDVRGPRASG